MTRGAESILVTSFVTALASNIVSFGCPELGIEVGRVAVSMPDGGVVDSKLHRALSQLLEPRGPSTPFS